MLQSEINCNLISNNFKEQFSFRSSLLHLFIFSNKTQIRKQGQTFNKNVVAMKF